MTGGSGGQRAISPVIGSVFIIAIVLLLSVVTDEMILDRDQEREPAPEVAIGNNNIVIADASRSPIIDDSSDVVGGDTPTVYQAPLTRADVDTSDDRLELVYLSKSGQNLRYLDNTADSGNIEIKTLTDGNGDPIDGDAEQGVT